MLKSLVDLVHFPQKIFGFHGLIKLLSSEGEGYWLNTLPC